MATPVITVRPRNAPQGQFDKVEWLFNAWDPEGDPITLYYFQFLNDNFGESGTLNLAGVTQTPYQGFAVKPENLSQLSYQAGRPGGKGARLRVWAGDASGWSQPADIQLQFSPAASNNRAPSVSATQTSFSSGSSVAVSNFLRFTDAERDAIVEYRFKDGSSGRNGGYFTLNGQKMPADKGFSVAASDLGTVAWVAGASGSKDTIEVGAIDAKLTVPRTYASFELSVPASSTPAVQPRPQPPSGGRGSQQFYGIDLSRFSFKPNQVLPQVLNEQKFETFIGPNFSSNNNTPNPLPGASANYSFINLPFGLLSAGANLSTGSTNFKAGIDIKGGYNLGSASLSGKLGGTVDYSPSNKTLRITPVASAPKVNLEVPSAYLKATAIADIAVNPSVSGYLKIPGKEGSVNAPLPSLNHNKSYNLIDLDTKNFNASSGQTISRDLLNLGNAVTAQVNLPNFNWGGYLPKPLAVPSGIKNNAKWASGVGPEFAYGYRGSSNLVNVRTSLLETASKFGLPTTALAASGRVDVPQVGSIDYSYKLVDATLSASADLRYEANVAFRPNLWVEPEGGRRQPIDSLTGITLNNVSDLNRDKQITLKLGVDPIIGVNVKLGLEGNLGAQATALAGKLTATGNVPGIGPKSAELGFGPLWTSPQLTAGKVNLLTPIDATRVFSASELFPDVVAALTQTINIPV